jgi:hypothetical protein
LVSALPSHLAKHDRRQPRPRTASQLPAQGIHLAQGHRPVVPAAGVGGRDGADLAQFLFQEFELVAVSVFLNGEKEWERVSC